MDDNYRLFDITIGNSWKAVSFLTILLTVILALIWLFCNECRDGIRNLMAMLPIYMALVFIFFTGVTVITVTISETRKWSKNRKKVDSSNLNEIEENKYHKDREVLRLKKLEA